MRGALEQGVVVLVVVSGGLYSDSGQRKKRKKRRGSGFRTFIIVRTLTYSRARI